MTSPLGHLPIQCLLRNTRGRGGVLQGSSPPKQTHTRSYQRQGTNLLSSLTEEAFLFCLPITAVTLRQLKKGSDGS